MEDRDLTSEQVIAEAEQWAATTKPTKAQRQSLYRMGRSRSFVAKYARTRADAAAMMADALAEMARRKAR